ncbi:MAG: hypothetical protein RR893_05665 [Clostridia bacterium]
MTTEQLGREASYRAALAILKDWLRQGLVTDKEYVRIDAMFARKFSPVWGDISPLRGAKRSDIA